MSYYVSLWVNKKKKKLQCDAILLFLFYKTKIIENFHFDEKDKR